MSEILSKKWWKVLFLNAFISCLILPGMALAARESLTISPLRTEVNLATGQSYNGSIKLKNDGDQALDVEIYSADFSVTNEAYDQEFSQPDNPLAVNNWFDFEQTKYRLAPHSSQVVRYKISAPSNAEPGGHYATIFAQTKGQVQKPSDVVEIKRVASLVYITIAGEISKGGNIESLNSKFWHSTSPINSQLRLKNSGNVHYRVDGYERLKNILNQEVTSSRINGLLLPNTVRAINTTIDAPKWPGLYRLEAQVSFPGGKINTTSKWILYLPPGYIALLGIVLIGAVVVLVRYLMRKKRR